jgi:ABC-type multidrug transport system fused ATPase/permease subunit
MIEVFSTLWDELFRINFNLIIVAGIVFAVSYYISRFFEWIVFRLILILIAINIAVTTFNTNSILFNLSTYMVIGIIAPHFHLMHVMMYRAWYWLVDTYEKTLEIVRKIIDFFISVYDFLLSVIHFFQNKYMWFKDYRQTKQEEQNSSQNNYHKEERQQQNKKQQSSNNEYEDSKQNKQQSHQNEEKQKQQSSNQQHKSKKHSRWDSEDPFIILGLSYGATKEEIKKQYKRLMREYHPDLAPESKKAQYTKIAQRLNWAYDELKR